MRNILDIKKSIENETDLLIYNFLSDNLKNLGSKDEYKFIAAQIYNSTMKYFYEYSDDEKLINKALNRLLNIGYESFEAIALMSIYSSVLKSKRGKILTENNIIKQSKASNKTIKYLMNKTGYYDYVLYTLLIGEELGVSDKFVEMMLDYFRGNEEVIRAEIKLIDVFHNKEAVLESVFVTEAV